MKEQQVRDIIMNTLQISGKEVDESAKKQWDSLTHVSILVALDTEFEGRLADLTELQDAYSVEGILSVLRSHKLLAHAGEGAGN